MAQERPKHWDIHPKAMESDDWLHIGDRYRVCPWSISGVESCIVVATEDYTVAFDMGYPFPASVKCQHVFISHGHQDHVAAIVSHASKRGLQKMPPATYYVPPHLVEPLTVITEKFSEMNEDPIRLKIKPVKVDDIIQLPSNILVKPFPTVHRVRSQGYIVYKVKKTLKPDYKDMPSRMIGSLVRDGQDIFDIEHIPQVAYTGDTISDAFLDPHNPDILRVDLLITESTYIDDEHKNTIQKARDRGHMHVSELIQYEAVFEDVKNILLVHFSDKYSTGYIRKTLDAKLPRTMKHKVHLGLLYKQKFEHRR